MCGWSPLYPWSSFKTLRKTRRMRSRPERWSAFESMLNSTTSALPATARWMSPKSIASCTFVRKNSTAGLSWPTWACVRLRKRYERTFRRWDLPLPKNPEIQMPILPAGLPALP
jgi:hypothetical protein